MKILLNILSCCLFLSCTTGTNPFFIENTKSPSSLYKGKWAEGNNYIIINDSTWQGKIDDKEYQDLRFEYSKTPSGLILNVSEDEYYLAVISPDPQARTSVQTKYPENLLIYKNRKNQNGDPDYTLARQYE